MNKHPALHDIEIINNRFDHLIHEIKQTELLLNAVISDDNYKQLSKTCFTEISDLIKQKQKILVRNSY